MLVYFPVEAVFAFLLIIYSYSEPDSGKCHYRVSSFYWRNYARKKFLTVKDVAEVTGLPYATALAVVKELHHTRSFTDGYRVATDDLIDALTDVEYAVWIAFRAIEEEAEHV